MHGIHLGNFSGTHGAHSNATARHGGAHESGRHQSKIEGGDHKPHEHGHRRHERAGHDHAHRRGAQNFHREARHALGHHGQNVQTFSKVVTAYSTEPQDAAEAATSLLNTAKSLISQAPENYQESIETLQSKIEIARVAASTVATDDTEIAAIDEAANLVSQGLNAVGAAESEAATSAGEFAELSAQRRQQYTIRLRTQEGDIVKIELRQSERLNTSEQSPESTAANAEIEAGSEYALKTKTSLRLVVKGDLNEAELEAIKSVVEQAAGIAEAFLEGDLAEALQATSGLEFNSAQLARINLHFKTHTSAEGLYAPPSVPTPAPVPVPAENGIADLPPPASGIPAESGPAPTQTVTPVAATEESSNAAEVQTVSEDSSGAVAPSINTVDDLASALGAFFATTISGLEQLQASDDTPDADRYRLESAFKTDVLKASFIATAPDEVADAVADVADSIEAAATQVTV